MAATMPAELVCTALQFAIGQRQPWAGLIEHLFIFLGRQKLYQLTFLRAVAFII